MEVEAMVRFVTVHLLDLPASVVLECSLAHMMTPAGARLSQILPVVHVPPFPIRTMNDPGDHVRPEVEATVRTILASRVDVDRLFPDPQTIHELTRLSGGCLRQLLQLAHVALEFADSSGEDTVSSTHVDQAARRLAAPLALLATPEDHERLATIAQTRQITTKDASLVARSLVFVYEEGVWADINPLLPSAPAFEILRG